MIDSNRRSNEHLLMILLEWRKSLFAKLTACSTHSLPANPLVKTSYLTAFACPFMAQLFGFLLLRSFEVTKTISSVGFGLSLVCAILILHCTAQLHSLFGLLIVVQRSSKPLSAALKPQSSLIRDVFVQSSTLTYTSIGYDSIFGSHHKKIYTD